MESHNPADFRADSIEIHQTASFEAHADYVGATFGSAVMVTDDNGMSVEILAFLLRS